MATGTKVPKKPVGSYTVVKPTAASLRLVKPFIVDAVIRWARENDYCDEVEGGLDAVFGKAPVTGWRDSDGFDCEGRDADGFDEDGYDKEDYHKDGFGHYSERTRDGYDRKGYDRAGYNRDGINANGEPRGHMEAYIGGLSEAERVELYTLLRKATGW